MIKQKIIIYSVSTNNYDDFIFDKSISRIFKSNPNLKYYVFTDKKVDTSLFPFIEQVIIKKKSHKKNFTIYFYKKRKKISLPNNISVDRYIKLNPIEVLPKHNISIYHDARITLYPNIIKELSKYNLNFDLICMSHRYRRTFEEELIICLTYKKINLKKYFKIIKFANYSSFTSKENSSIKLSENGLLIRKNNPLIASLSKEWTKLTILTLRDQLSLPLTLNYLKNLNLKRRFLKQNFKFSKICHLRTRKKNYPKFQDYLKKIIYFIRFIFINLLHQFLKSSLKLSEFLSKKS